MKKNHLYNVYICVGTKEDVLKFQQNIEKLQYDTEPKVDTTEEGSAKSTKSSWNIQESEDKSGAVKKTTKKRKLVSSKVCSLFIHFSLALFKCDEHVQMGQLNIL